MEINFLFQNCSVFFYSFGSHFQTCIGICTVWLTDYWNTHASSQVLWAYTDIKKWAKKKYTWFFYRNYQTIYFQEEINISEGPFLGVVYNTILVTKLQHREWADLGRQCCGDFAISLNERTHFFCSFFYVSTCSQHLCHASWHHTLIHCVLHVNWILCFLSIWGLIKNGLSRLMSDADM